MGFLRLRMVVDACLDLIYELYQAGSYEPMLLSVAVDGQSFLRMASRHLHCCRICPYCSDRLP